MSASAALASCTWTVGSRSVTLTVPQFQPGKPVHLAVEWSPDQPSRLSTEEWAEYKAGRQHALGQLAERLGVSAVVIELL